MILTLLGILSMCSCSVSFRNSNRLNSNSSGTGGLDGNIAIKTNSPLEVIDLDTSHALALTPGNSLQASGIGLIATGSGIGATGNGLNAIGSGLNSNGNGIESVNITDLNSTINISINYSGTGTLNDCSVNVIFNSMDCIIDSSTVTITRQELSNLIGNHSSVPFFVNAGISGFAKQASNPLNAMKHKITQISNIHNGGEDSILRTVMDSDKNILYFVSVTDSNKKEIYSYDGSSIIQISGMNSGDDDWPSFLTMYKGNLYFSRINNCGTYCGLYKYDGTNITRISDINESLSSPSNLAVYNDALYFSALKQNGSTSKLYKYDGDSIMQISNINPSADDGPSNVTGYNGAIYFSANNSFGYNKLYKYDGTSITQISDINPSNITPRDDDEPQLLTVYKGSLYFSALGRWGNNSYHKMYKYDGTSIIQISDINPGNDDNISFITADNDTLYFSAFNGIGHMLYKYDGASITQISATNDWPINLTIYKGSLYFAADSGSGFYKLYRYNGVDVTQISDINTGDSDFVSFLTASSNALYFSAINNSFYTKLYKFE